MPKPSSDYPERFVRTLGLYGAEGFAAIRRSTVLVVGQGGVGAHASLALARSGIGRLILVDFDRLTASSLNRFPAPVAEESLGRLKADLMQTFLSRCCPHTETISRPGRFDAASADEILALRPDHVIDAIDPVEAKVLLLGECLRRGVPVISSMGAAGKVEASQVRVADISGTTTCPLAAHVRRALRRQGITDGIKCVYSLEKSTHRQKTGFPGSDEGLPSSINLPGIFGYALAAEVCEDIARKC